MSRPSATRVAERWMNAARSPIREAVAALAATSQSRYPEDAPEDIEDALGEAIDANAGALPAKLVKFMREGKGKALVGREHEYEEGREDEEGYRTISTNWTITYPTSVTLEHGIFTKLARIVKEFMDHNIVRDHKFEKRDLAVFFKDRAVLRYVEERWLSGVKDAISDLGEYGLIERAEEIAYDNSDYNVVVTEYTEDSEEEWPEGPEIRYTFDMRWEGAKLLKGEMSGEKLSFRMSVKYEVKIMRTAYPSDYDYDRMYGA